jgi:hypothetical protein
MCRPLILFFVAIWSCMQTWCTCEAGSGPQVCWVFTRFSQWCISFACRELIAIQRHPMCCCNFALFPLHARNRQNQLLTLNMEINLMECYLIEQIRFLTINHAKHRNHLILLGFGMKSPNFRNQLIVSFLGMRSAQF